MSTLFLAKKKKYFLEIIDPRKDNERGRYRKNRLKKKCEK